MIYTKQVRLSNEEMERIGGITSAEVCLKTDCYYDRIHEEWVVNCLCVSSLEVIGTLFPSLIAQNACFGQ